MKTKQRLKKKEMILNLFSLFSEKYDSVSDISIFDIVIPVEEIQNYLEKNFSIQYTSSTWILTQIKRYESLIGYPLFQKIKSQDNPDSFSLALYNKMSSYYQFQHICLNQKLKIANGVFDHVINSRNEWGNSSKVTVLLGSGTNCYHVANIIAEKSDENKIFFDIYTHNFGIQSSLMQPDKLSQYINIYSPAGKIDPVGNTIVGNDNDLYLNTKFDFIIQSTNTIFNRDLYVKTKEEGERKQVILKKCTGIKILALVMDEFKKTAGKGMFCYGNLSDYDYIVIPKTRGNRNSEYEIILKDLEDFIAPEIISWNYVIYKTVKSDA